jgi:hypothetical protein
MGFPAAPAAEVRRQWVHIRKIGGLLARVAALEKKPDQEPLRGEAPPREDL